MLMGSYKLLPKLCRTPQRLQGMLGNELLPHGSNHGTRDVAVDV